MISQGTHGHGPARCSLTPVTLYHIIFHSNAHSRSTEPCGIATTDLCACCHPTPMCTVSVHTDLCLWAKVETKLKLKLNGSRCHCPSMLPAPYPPRPGPCRYDADSVWTPSHLHPHPRLSAWVRLTGAYAPQVLAQCLEGHDQTPTYPYCVGYD